MSCATRTGSTPRPPRARFLAQVLGDCFAARWHDRGMPSKARVSPLAPDVTLDDEAPAALDPLGDQVVGARYRAPSVRDGGLLGVGADRP